MAEILIIKNSGEKEPFSEQKVINSMQRVGVPRDLQPEVLEIIKDKLHDNIKTSEIFSIIRENIKTKDKTASIKLNLKKAIFDFGPTGFPFEKYIARIFDHLGYKTEVDLTMQGECITQEIDVLLEKDQDRQMAEVKFHNQPGVKTDSRVAMYTYARFLDVKGGGKINSTWLVTNTKLTEDAKRYCLCKGIRTLAWNYPNGQNLQSFVENPKLYPITILDSLTENDKTTLLNNDVVLCSELIELNQNRVIEMGIDSRRLEEAKQDSIELLGKNLDSFKKAIVESPIL